MQGLTFSVRNHFDKIGKSINIVLNPRPGIKNKSSNENIETGVSV